jgi:hypothetical protein
LLAEEAEAGSESPFFDAAFPVVEDLSDLVYVE